jgi:hypothetical protein
VCILYVKDISEKFKRVENRYIRAAFKIKQNRRSSLLKTRQKIYPHQTTQCVYNIRCQGGRNCVCETGRPLAVRFREGGNDVEGLLDKSELAQHVGFEVLTAGTTKSCTLLDITPYNLVNVNKTFGRTYHLHLQTKICLAPRGSRHQDGLTDRQS